MAGRLGPIEIRCDAPAYPFVRACRHIGLEDPEDVRWVRISELRGHSGKRTPKRTEGDVNHARVACRCGNVRCEVQLVVFTLSSGEEVSYLLGQCSRCRTIFWDEP